MDFLRGLPLFSLLILVPPSKEMMSSHETMENKQHDDTEATTVALRDFIESFQADSTGESCYDECESKRRRKVLLGKIVPELRNITTLSQVMNYWKTNQEKYQGLFDNRAAVLIIIDALLSISSKPLSQDATSEYGLGMLDVLRGLSVNALFLLQCLDTSTSTTLPISPSLLLSSLSNMYM